nr:hypothetical protein [Micromonospora sp. DSM 115978]
DPGHEVVAERRPTHDQARQPSTTPGRSLIELASVALPLVAFGCAVATVLFAGIAAIAQTAPSVLAGAGGAGI